MGALRRARPARLRVPPRVPSRVRRRARRHARRLRPVVIAIVLMALAAAQAGPNLFAGTVHRPCPDAVLPMRIGTFQPLPGEPFDLQARIALDEFKESLAWVSVRPGGDAITVVVFAYVGSLADTMLFEIATANGTVTWRTAIPLEPPDAGRLTLSFYPYYATIEVPPAAWRSVFPENGPYELRAWRPKAPSTYGDAFCAARATTWLLVTR